MIKALDGRLHENADGGVFTLYADLAGTKAKDADVAQLQWLRPLRRVHLGTTQVTDAGLVHLGKLHELTDLDLSGRAWTS